MSESVVGLRVSGRVQGVGFRFFCQRKAHEYGVSGWVRNCADGTVEAVVSGAEDAVARFIAAVKHGPKFGRVEHVAIDTSLDSSAIDFEPGRFVIR